MASDFARRALNLSVSLAVAAALGGCFGDGTDEGSTATPSTPDAGGTSAVTIDGTVFASNVNGSAVELYAADAQGRASGTAIATATTDANGRYHLTLTTLPTGALLLLAKGGTYVSEADGSTQTLGTFSALIASLSAGANTVHVNPVTTTIAAATANLLAQSGGLPATVQAAAATTVKRLLGLSALAGDPQAIAADPLATAGDGWLLAALAGTLEQLRANSGIVAADLYKALQDDLADGKIDGLMNGQVVTVGSASPLQSSLFTTQWSGAANAYGAAKPTYAAATAAISGALQTSAQANGVALGSSGSIAPLVTQTAGTQLYFAARADGLVVLNMRDPANPTAAKVAAINAAVMKNAGGSFFTSLDGIVIDPTPINTASGAKVFALLYSYLSSTVVAVNLTDGVVADSAALSITSTASFSGASAKIAGGIADGKRGLIWLATADGLMGINPADLKATPVKIALPAGMEINENLGGDPARDIVYNHDYNNNGVVVFNLAEAKAYTLSDAALTTLVNGKFGFTEVDGVALDSQYSVAVVNPEGSNTVGLFTYATPSGATTPVGTLPTPKFAAFTIGSTGASFAGAAIDPVTHTVLMVGEGRNLGVGVLDDPSSANWKGFSKVVTGGTASTYRFEPHDPHTLGAFNVLGKPYGFLLQGSLAPYKVAVLDLNAFLAASTATGATAGDPMVNTTITRLVGY